ncbi:MULTISPECIES: hypothetical protein [unclassified Streptomyces]|uniref:hypothetical protein n=1 Tax=unclassified Streptomyces TaxID=2593676 RepID=UPI003369C46B
MTWHEWEQLKKTAAERIQLDSASSGGGVPEDGIMVYQDDLGAVGSEAFRLHTELKAKADLAGMGADKHGDSSTAQAAAALKKQGFAMAAALDKTLTTWSVQVKTVLQACANISNHLDYTKKLHAHEDAKIAADLRGKDGLSMPASRLNKYFK